MLEYISPETWATFKTKFPAAYNFLNHAALLQEYITLTKEKNTDGFHERERYIWICERINDIEIFCPHIMTEAQDIN